MDNITIGDDKMNDVEKLKQEYEEEGVAAECERLIGKVLPEIRIIADEMASEHKRPVVQYISSRVKTPISIADKLYRKKRDITLEKALGTLNDLAGIRVVCSFQDDVYRTVKAIKKLECLSIVKVKDYIAHPKSSGYRSIHIVAEVPQGDFSIRLEIQVCSAAMNYWAMLEHQLSYKNRKGDPKEIEKIQKELKSYSIQIAKIDKKFLRTRKRIEEI